MVELKDDATDAPDVTGIRPAQLQDDLRSSVVPGRHDGGVVLPLERRRPEVDQLDARVAHASHRLLRHVSGRRRRRHRDAVDEPVVGDEQHVLGLEIGVRQLVVVHEPDRVAQLVGDVAHLLERVRHVRVALQEVKDGLAEDLEGEAHVAEVIEGVVHPNAEVLALRVLRVQLLEDVDLELGGFPVLVDVLDDLERHVGVGLQVPDSSHLPESSFSERRQNLVPLVDDVTGQVGQVAVGVVGHWRPLPLQDGAVQGRAVRLEGAGSLRESKILKYLILHQNWSSYKALFLVVACH